MYDDRYDRNNEDMRAAPPDEQGRRHSHGGFGGDLMAVDADAHLIFVGFVSCLRHKPFMRSGALMREGRMSILCPSMTDFAIGRFLHQIEEAILELSEERKVKKFILIYGCQSVILSADYELLAQQMLEEHGITVTVRDNSHLCDGENAWEGRQ